MIRPSVCDGLFEDCSFGEDEIGCPEEEVPVDCDAVTQFTCNDGSCIPANYECDLIPDCPVAEDEHDDCVITI